MRKELEDIKAIREENNVLWLGIIDIALRHAPDETRKLLASIRRNDLLVTSQMENLVMEEILDEDRGT